MPTPPRRPPQRRQRVAATPKSRTGKVRPDAETVLARLRQLGSKRVLAGYARFGIEPMNALGIEIAKIQALARELGPRHDLVDALWASGIYEARLLVAFVGEPHALTQQQMEDWCADFDNWGIVDTLCFKLFDRSRHAWGRIAAWRQRRPEFAKRASFALLASLALHDEAGDDAPYLAALPWIETAAADPRNYVKKGVLWALRGVGSRNRNLHAASLALADRLAASADPTARWIGKGAGKELRSAATKRRLARSS